MKKHLLLLQKIMRYTLLIYAFIIASTQILFADNSNGQVLNKRINIAFKNENLLDAIEKLQMKSGVDFAYDPAYLKLKKFRTEERDFSNEKIEEILMAIFDDTGLTFREEVKGTITLIKNDNPGKITGKIVDENGDPLPGANIKILELNTGTQSHPDGTYSINAAPGVYTLTISFISYTSSTQTKVVVKAGETTKLNVSLTAQTGTLSEVLVVGYGTQKRENATGAVDQISSKSLENRPVPNLTQGLQGLLPNLNIKMMDGKPTQSPSYNIRGTTSIGQGGSALILIDGFEGDPSLLNPNDVETVSILKDAASAAIYGARGAFGVVLITTKRPEKGRTTVNFSSNFALKNPLQTPDFVTDGYTWAKMFAEAFVNGDGSFPQNANKTQKFSQAYLDEFKKRAESGQPYNQVEVNPTTGEYTYYGSTDWYGELYKKNTVATENNLSISGSSDKTAFLISGRFLGQDGLFRYNTDDYNMKNIRAKGSVQVFPWLTIENNADYSVMNYHNPINVGEGGGIWRNIADEGHPTMPMFNPDGSLTFTSAYTVGDFYYGKNGIDTKKQVFRNITGLRSNFFNNKFRVNADFTFRNTNNDRNQKRVQVPYSNIKGQTSYVGTTTNDLLFERRETQYLAANIYGEFENKFGADHYLKLMAGYNYEESTYNRLSTQRNGIIFEDATDLNLALGQAITTGGGYEQWAILGGFSRLNYSFKDRYLIEVNARYDGSSKFPSGQRYGFFPSISGGWRVNKESFWNVSDKIISDLKVRASYGSLGNGNINSYEYQELFSITQSPLVLGGVRPQTTRLPGVLPDQITWETSTTTNFGLDLAMLSNRLIFSGDAYVRKTTDMFTVGLTAPAVFGNTVPKGNYADLTTRGWEASVTWNDRIGNGDKPFKYNVRLTLSDSKSKIDKYNNPNKLLTDVGNNGTGREYYEGQTIGEIWGYETEGFFIDQADIDSHAKQSPQMRASPTNIWYPGDIKLKDTNGDGFINIGDNTVAKPGDRRIIGNSAPRYLYSVSLGADWNNFFFSTFFQGVGKQQWYPSTETEMFWGQYNRPYNNIPTFHVGNMWTPENTNAYFPRTMSRAASSNTNRELGVAQTKYLQNVAYLRLKNLQIGYNLPARLISRIGARSAKVFFSGENLFTYSPLYKVVKTIDVENAVPSDQDLNSGSTNGDGYNYPLMKSYSLGLSLGF
ncbi:TonB-dependent receptor [Pedobacter foliorum]|uniref:SusC/RagA family TonB-linked outer membrane protein n=1 Tax=Pedobacter foliorum TaxID=2739058 RepID=UPI0015651E05|nr:TonB-dependent receptor [Pedobacter foliorum]NRF41499.1 TonB-dependent receptor [Pedobacter foliorum]